MLLMACLSAGTVALSAASAVQPPADDELWQAWDGVPVLTPAWTVRVEADVWYAAIEGDVTLPGAPEGTSSTYLEDLNLDSPRVSPAGSVVLRHGAWRFDVAADSTGVEAGSTMVGFGQIGEVAYAPGDFLESDLRLTTIEATAGYRLLETRRGRTEDGHRRLVVSVDAQAGFRAAGMSLDVSGPSGTTGADEWFILPLVAASMEVELWERFSLDLGLSAGGMAGLGDQESSSFDVVVGFEWRPLAAIGVRVGYRLVGLGLSTGDGQDQFEFEGTSAGLIFGVSARF
jgi:hypothetical protein